ncbi:murein DD-endopeptidase MepM/ murein hydrolase activator NlpD [Alkalibacillus flavidus]|uniref:Murein DD-endopeptidase MepM/ murein hydrolase activator NlpD n=1 Tax=Alkalibacillus flavidus TaxID=546021 RepID=A0ABV2KW40_9BACI
MKRHHRWRILIMSETDQQVKRFSLHKIVAFSAIAIVFVLAVSVTVTLTMLNQLSADNQALQEKINEQEGTITAQRTNIETFEEEHEKIESDLVELSQLETQISEMITALEPSDIPPVDEDGPQGGIELAINESTHEENSETIELARLSDTGSSLLERYEKAVSELDEVRSDLKTVPIEWPADTDRITSEFGTREDPFTYAESFHSGLDLADDWGTEIYAAADGTVTLAGRDGGYGLSVEIDHPNTYETKYAHLADIDVEEGQSVEQGDLIGLMGSTGRSTGVHLHYEVFNNGETIDPYPYMTFLQRVLND